MGMTLYLRHDPPGGAGGAPDRLSDADREPRRHHAAGSRGAGPGRHDRLRGHAPHAGAARAARDRREQARQPPRAQRNSRAPASCASGSRGGAHVALVSDAGTPRRLRSRLRADPGVHPGGAAGRGAAGAERDGHGARRLGAAGGALVLRRLPAAQARRAARAARRGRADAGRVRVAAPRRGDARAARRDRPARPVAVCRELSKLHEEVVRGSAAELAARYAQRAAAGGDRARDRRRAARRRSSARRRSRPCASWCRRAPGRVRRPPPSRG